MKKSKTFSLSSDFGYPALYVKLLSLLPFYGSLIFLLKNNKKTTKTLTNKKKSDNLMRFSIKFSMWNFSAFNLLK
jgi:hypothetical protein